MSQTIVRARDLGLSPGNLDTGPLNSICDIAGISVGHRTLIRGDNIRTGVTVVIPHAGNVYQQKVPAAIAIGNGYGKFCGVSQIQELGEIETPIALTNTLSVPEVAAGLIEWTLSAPGNESVTSVNPIVGETNDAWVNDIRARAVRSEDVLHAIADAKSGPLAEGSVGAGTGTQAFAWKGGIGTSSRRLAPTYGGYGVGVLVQTNYSGSLTVMGVPIASDLDRMYGVGYRPAARMDGSVVVVVATDAPLSDRNLRRLASRAFLGIARTGSWMENGSGDYALAFSTAETVRRSRAESFPVLTLADLANDCMSPLFEAVVDATEEAVYNAIVAADTIESRLGTLRKVPLDSLQRILADRRAGSA